MMTLRYGECKYIAKYCYPVFDDKGVKVEAKFDSRSFRALAHSAQLLECSPLQKCKDLPFISLLSIFQHLSISLEYVLNLCTSILLPTILNFSLIYKFNIVNLIQFKNL